jgi:hypothetical protein
MEIAVIQRLKFSEKLHKICTVQFLDMLQTLVIQNTIKNYISLQFRMIKHFPHVYFYTF